MNTIKFAVFTDLHYEHIPDGCERMMNFLNNIKDENVDFIMNLGDFCSPNEDNNNLIDMLNTNGKPYYHVIGNHDSDLYPKEKVINFLKMDYGYYTFTYGKVKFIVLDTCYIKTDNGYEPYFKRNYDKSKDIYPILPDYEFEWLENQLNDNSEYYVIFSHHSLENDFAKRGVYNREEIRKLINRVNNKGKKVLLCVNGHDHGDAIEKIGETYYFSLNAMSYIWCGPEHEHFCYSDEIHKQYPFIKDMILYKDGLYAIVKIGENGHINIKGMRGEYQNITPREVGLGYTWNGRSVLPVVSSLTDI